MQIKSNLFELSKTEQETSKMFYNGKIIKCLVAPYHTYQTLEKIVPFTKNTYLFPEREVPSSKLSQIVSMIVANPSQEEFRIITTNQSIIMDMIDGCVRVLTESGDIIPSPIKTLMANIHDIRYSLLENESHRLSESKKSESNSKVNEILEEINSSNSITQKKYNELESRIQMIGEDLIRNVMMNHLNDKTII